MDNKITVIIDGTEIQAEPGSTVLQAARSAGINIPTFCYLERMEPFASCFMCVVRIKGGRDNLVPSCSTPVFNGMEVETQTEEILNARRAALELMLSDHTGDCFAPCHSECPTGVDIPGFINALQIKDNEKAISIIKESLPIPGCLGRVCPAPCESACRRTLVDESVSIMSLKRYAADEDMKKDEKHRYFPEMASPSGKSVAVVGAGPAGISAAYFSKILGHEVDVFDSHAAPGGMIRYGIPSYRLPRNVIDSEVDVLVRMGINFNYGKTMGSNFTLDELREKYDAVFLGLGAQDASPMRVDGEDAEGVFSAIKFLEEVSAGTRTGIGKKVMIVGGGNSAIDAARTAVRLDAEESVIYYRRTREEMPAFDFEIDEAIDDGVKMEFLSAPVKIQRQGEKLAVSCIRMELGEPDSSGRRRPVPVEGSEHTVFVDAVIAAIGQKVARKGIEGTELELSKWGTIEVDNNTLMTSIPGVFSGGDSVLGPDIAVRASGMGKLAAVSMNQYLNNLPVTGSKKLFKVVMGGLEDIQKAVYERFEESPRAKMAHIESSVAIKSFDEVSLGFTARQVEEETARCMECGCRAADSCKLREYSEEFSVRDDYFATETKRPVYYDDSHKDIILESNKCITCGNCVRICEEDRKCYALAFEKRGFQTVIRPPLQKKLSETSCDGCGKCVDDCPTGALSYKTAPVWTEVIRKI
ncbi:MAG: FAD-dependent oxidoreductase [Deltaproteobacteria bacterium]|nr:FAD-dependent oxidoreductase [Deltaproteobacteria bacterium]